MAADPPPRQRLLGGAVDALREARWLTRSRLVLYGCVFAAASIYLLVAAVGYFTANGLIAADGEPLAPDFLNYFAGAKVAASGQALLAYNYEWFLAFERALVGPVTPRIYAYPPLLLLLSLPLALFSYVPALIVWTLLGVGLAFWLLRRLAGWQAAAVAVVGAPTAFNNLLAGNNGYFTAVLLGGGLMLLQRRPVIAGICFGCLAYKPHLGLLLPFALAADARWRTIAAAAITVALLAAVTVALFGTATWIAFIHQMAFSQRVLQSDAVLWRGMLTVFVTARQLGAPSALAYAVQAVSTALALATVVIVWRRPGSADIKAAVLTVATFLATPYGMDYDGVVLIFAAAWLGREGTRTGFLPWERLAIVALLVFPLATVPTAMLAGVSLTPVLLWPVLLLLVRRALGEPIALRRAAA